jgi:hypothetical protein
VLDNCKISTGIKHALAKQVNCQLKTISSQLNIGLSLFQETSGFQLSTQTDQYIVRSTLKGGDDFGEFVLLRRNRGRGTDCNVTSTAIQVTHELDMYLWRTIRRVGHAEKLAQFQFQQPFVALDL